MAGKPVPSSHKHPLQAEGTSELNVRKEGAHGWEKPEPQSSKPGGTHLCRARKNKTHVPDVQRQCPINATNAVKKPQTSNPKAL